MGKGDITFGSLFAGIGGFDLGLERAGMTPLWQVEIDDFCNRVLEKHWPDVKRYRDVRQCGIHNLQAVDLICGGFPCQPHSHAGKRRGAEDDRDLWPEFRRIIDELRPRWIVAENVPGIRTTILDAVLSDLEGLGYSWQTAIIPACAVDAPHRRDRVWIVAHGDKNGQHITGKDNKKQKGNICRESTPNLRPIMADAQERSIRTGLCTTETTGQWQRRFSNGNCKMESSTGFVKPRLGGMAHGLSPWLDEPRNVPRVATGIPDRVNRLKALGNAVVPQVVEFIGRNIMNVERLMNGQG